MEEGLQSRPDDWVGVRGRQSLPRLAEEEGSRSLPTSFPGSPGKWSEAIAGGPSGPDCPRPQLAKEQPSFARLWEARQGRSTQRTRRPGRPPSTPHAYVLGPGLPGPRFLVCLHTRNTNAGWAHNGKGFEAFYGLEADPCPTK